ncbi:unnamed protein product [Prorocentrum cordatum]|uniref:Uncharacterized protein n=1 Tax=Prorocentrum cordatum TaxID=2364126 RepID=A0ABN9VEY6_9DINO|nr:unnamed protein product [Polarella glacialis]
MPHLGRPRQKPALELGKQYKEWLEFVRPPSWLKSTDITSTEFVGEPFKCKTNLTSKDAPFLHPFFQFRIPVFGVRVRLKDVSPGALKADPKGEGRLLWDAVFFGGPGNDYTVTNTAVPTGKRPLFPEFCPPLRRDAKYELRLTHWDDSPKFDELLELVVKRKVLQRQSSGPDHPPRPAVLDRPGARGPVHAGDAAEVLEASGRPAVAFL